MVTGGRRMTQQEQDFRDALSIVKVKGFEPPTVYAHASWETGRFAHLVGNFNYWGIKKPQGWLGKIVTVSTFEIIDGKQVNMKCDFADWPNASSALCYYCDKIERMYPDAFANRLDYTLYYAGLMTGVWGAWSTSPTYNTDLCNHREELQKEGLLP
jgi:flagellum-specific peptidoglycan hydrolase FlgJ